MTTQFKTVIWGTPRDQERGLQHLRPIPDDVLFIFTDIEPGTSFHSRNVTETFEIAFVDRFGRVLEERLIMPPTGTATAPPGTVHAIETKEGVMSKLDLRAGKRLNLEVLLRKGS